MYTPHSGRALQALQQAAMLSVNAISPSGRSPPTKSMSCSSWPHPAAAAGSRVAGGSRRFGSCSGQQAALRCQQPGTDAIFPQARQCQPCAPGSSGSGDGGGELTGDGDGTGEGEGDEGTGDGGEGTGVPPSPPPTPNGLSGSGSTCSGTTGVPTHAPPAQCPCAQ